MNAPNKSVLSVRVSAQERATLEAAAQAQHTSLSEFLRRMGLQAAETELLQRSHITIPAQDWAAFESFIGAPTMAIAGLDALARRRPSWEELDFVK